MQFYNIGNTLKEVKGIFLKYANRFISTHTGRRIRTPDEPIQFYPYYYAYTYSKMKREIRVDSAKNDYI